MQAKLSSLELGNELFSTGMDETGQVKLNGKTYVSPIRYEAYSKDGGSCLNTSTASATKRCRALKPLKTPFTSNTES